MFQVHINAIDSQCLSYEVIVDNAWLWNLKYGHLNFYGLNTLKSREVVHGFHKIRFLANVCENCLIGKKTKKTFVSLIPMGAQGNFN